MITVWIDNNNYQFLEGTTMDGMTLWEKSQQHSPALFMFANSQSPQRFLWAHETITLEDEMCFTTLTDQVSE